MKNRIIISAGSLLLLSFASCVNNKMPEPQPLTVSACDSIPATFSGQVNPIIQQNCAITGCHVPGGTGTNDYTSYAGVKANVDNGSFRHSVIEGQPPVMPPTGQLPAEQLRILECWLNNGAPND